MVVPPILYVCRSSTTHLKPLTYLFIELNVVLFHIYIYNYCLQLFVSFLHFLFGNVQIMYLIMKKETIQSIRR